jgi:hypothetical protein
VSVKVDAFHRVFAEGVPFEQARVLAVSQRPLAAVAFSEPASAAAWKTKPSWGIVSTSDHTINPDVERFGYQRAGLREVLEIESSHLASDVHPPRPGRGAHHQSRSRSHRDSQSGLIWLVDQPESSTQLVHDSARRRKRSNR